MTLAAGIAHDRRCTNAHGDATKTPQRLGVLQKSRRNPGSVALAMLIVKPSVAVAQQQIEQTHYPFR
jgi:hypothetical protein